ncbi:MAG: hypothetical protein KIS96_08730 [Bauldia sp.]|nr:hypothetical protein [Bauldia sp.]
MTAGVRQLALTVHVVSSVGWLGAVIAFVALAVAGIASADPAMIDGAYRSMAVIAWSTVLPAGTVSAVTGVILSLGTRWGLLRHYWVVVKLVLTLVGLALLVIHMAPIDRLADAAAAPAGVGAGLGHLQTQTLVASGLAVLLLLFMTVLSIYKPRGRTRFGRLQQDQAALGRAPFAAR